MRVSFRSFIVYLSVFWSLIICSAVAREYKVDVLSDQLDTPWAIEVLADSSMFITERSGTLRYFDNGTLSEPAQGIPDVLFAGQGGLLDVMQHPNFALNKQLFFTLASGDAKANYLEVVTAKWDKSQNQLTDVHRVFAVKPYKDTPVHYGGRLTLLADNTLVLASGDGFDYRESAQLKSSLLGKMIRFNMDGSAPADNPFSGSELAKYIWSLGHRNPQALFYDKVSGLLFSHEHGPAGGDEINILEKGKNYGWPIITNGKDYSGASITPFKTYEGMEQPLFDWTPSIAPSDMILYRGSQFPDLQNKLLVTALKTREVQVLQYSDSKITQQTSILSDLDERFRAIEQDAQGNIYLLTDSGKLLRLAK